MAYRRASYSRVLKASVRPMQTAGSSWRLSSSNFSVNVGAGVMLINHLQLSANYNIACGKTGDVTVIDAATAATESILSSKGRSNAWQISLAYYF